MSAPSNAPGTSITTEPGKLTWVVVSVIFLLASCFLGYFIVSGINGIMRMERGSAYDQMEPVRQRVLVDKSHSPEMALDEWNKLQGYTTVDMVRAKLNDMNTANKIAADVTGDTALLVAAHYKPTDLVRGANGDLQLTNEGADADAGIRQNRALVEARMRGRIFATDDLSDDQILYAPTVLIGDPVARKEFNDVVWPSKTKGAKKLWLQETEDSQIRYILEPRNMKDAITVIIQDGVTDKRLKYFYVRALMDTEMSLLDTIGQTMSIKDREKFDNERSVISSLKFCVKGFENKDVKKCEDDIAAELLRIKKTTPVNYMNTFVDIVSILRTDSDPHMKKYSDAVCATTWRYVMNAIYGDSAASSRETFLRWEPNGPFDPTSRNCLFAGLKAHVREYLFEEIWLKLIPNKQHFEKPNQYDIIILLYLESITSEPTQFIFNYLLPTLRSNFNLLIIDKGQKPAITLASEKQILITLSSICWAIQPLTRRTLLNVLLDSSSTILSQTMDEVNLFYLQLLLCLIQKEQWIEFVEKDLLTYEIDLVATKLSQALEGPPAGNSLRTLLESTDNFYVSRLLASRINRLPKTDDRGRTKLIKRLEERGMKANDLFPKEEPVQYSGVGTSVSMMPPEFLDRELAVDNVLIRNPFYFIDENAYMGASEAYWREKQPRWHPHYQQSLNNYKAAANWRWYQSPDTRGKIVKFINNKT